MENAQTNRLAREKSPYLLQHAYNPVDWHPWGREAFEKARKEDKPIFLSIGYSTCHWCHVMERESFENREIAQYLNEHFVSIKVDREERPDVDKIYMTAVQAMTGQGGWPLSAFLTPDLKPFFGGTYFPPEQRHGRIGFPDLLQRIHAAWKSERAGIDRSADQLHQQIDQIVSRASAADIPPSSTHLHEAAAVLKREYDPRHGGFGGAPKFPQPSQPRFLLQQASRTKDEESIRMVLHTCDSMAAGGIYDQLGGGFSRYSVDAEWLVPHFEKMLYDNAQLVQLYLDAYLVSGEERHADVVRDILRYVFRDMTHPEGGFYSAEDADSEGKEGKFYCWTRAELSSLLTPEEFNVTTRFFGITEGGNFVDHSDPDPLPGQNVLSVVQPRLNGEDAALLDSARKKMVAARDQRVRPHRDEKVLTSWNGLMLGAVARAGAVLKDSAYFKAALKNAEFLKAHLWDSEKGLLYHRWKDGERDSVQLLNSYAFLLSGVLDLYEATIDSSWLQFAMDLAEAMIRTFHDPRQGGFWQSPEGSSDLILRVKDDYDGAEPSGNSVATFSLLKLSAITGRSDFRETAVQTFRFSAERIEKIPQAVPYLLMALDFSLQEPRRCVMAGPLLEPGQNELLNAAHSVYRPRSIILGTEGPVESFAGGLKSIGGKPAAYICSGTSCQPPTQDPAQIKKVMKES